MDLRLISDQELKTQTEFSVQNERRSIREVVEHISEVDRRRLYLEWGYASLFEFLTRHCKYSEASAYRRMQAARVLQSLPEMSDHLEEGHLNLTQLSKAQSAFKSEEKVSGKNVSVETRRDILLEIRAKSKNETEKILQAKLPAANSPMPASETHKPDDSVLLAVQVSKEAFAKLQRVKQLYGHLIPEGQWSTILEKMADDVIAKRDPARVVKFRKLRTMQSFAAAEGTEPDQTRKAQPKQDQPWENRPPEGEKETAQRVTSISIPAVTRRTIFQRDQFCQHRNKNGELCGSRFQLEIDHIKPRFAGGDHHTDNLRLHCRAHNQHRYFLGANIKRT